MRYYWFNRPDLSEKVKDKYNNDRGKQEAAKYYLKNREVLKEFQVFKQTIALDLVRINKIVASDRFKYSDTEAIACCYNIMKFGTKLKRD